MITERHQRSQTAIKSAQRSYRQEPAAALAARELRRQQWIESPEGRKAELGRFYKAAWSELKEGQHREGMGGGYDRAMRLCRAYH